MYGRMNFTFSQMSRFSRLPLAFPSFHDGFEKILARLDAKALEREATGRPPCRAPPQRGLVDDTV